jgi:hypothetical protein
MPIVGGMRLLRSQRAGPAVTTPRINNPRSRNAGDPRSSVSAAAIGDYDVEPVRCGNLANRSADRFRLIEGRNHEGHRLHRIPQFWQGAGGASDSRLDRKSR